MSLRDLTNQFFDAAKAADGLSQVQRQQLSSLALLRPARQRDDFTRAACSIRRSTEEVRRVLTQRHAEYLDPLRATESGRDALEHEVGISLRACGDEIALLSESVAAQPAARGGEQRLAHQHGAVLSLSEALKDVAGLFDSMRSARQAQALQAHRRRQRVAERAEAHARAHLPARVPAAAAAGSGGGGSGGGTGARTGSGGRGGDEGETGRRSEDELRLQQQESEMLAAELHGIVGQVRQAESRMLEVSALSQAFAQHVAAQASQIEGIYLQAVDASVNLARGNAELKKTIERSAGSRFYVAFILVAASLMLLFLDWQAG